MNTNEKSTEVGRQTILSHRDLIVWQKGIDLAVETYRLARLLPTEEKFILRPQILRAAVSIPSNIAEGHGQIAKGSYLSHLGISRGSLHELDSHFEIGKRLEYFDLTMLERPLFLIDEIGRMTWSLMTKLGGRKWRA